MAGFKDLMDKLKSRGMPEKPTSPDEAFHSPDSGSDSDSEADAEKKNPKKPKGPILDPRGVKSLRDAFR